MRKYIKDYIKIVESKLDNNLDKSDLDELKDKISFFSHERLIHMFIMLFCLFILLIFIFISIWNINFLIVMFILFVLNIFYVLHYYFLENSIQYLYKLYDKMNDKIK